MEFYAKVLLYVIPLFLGLIIFEIGYSYFIKGQQHCTMDTISGISSGFTHIVKDSLGLVVIIVSYPYLLEHLSFFEMPSSWIVYAVAFIILDFERYWYHRLTHHVNIFWNQHVIHHSSEEFNLTSSIRLPISNFLGYFPSLLIPAAVLGVPHSVVAILIPIHGFSQFWYHTKHIGKLGILEYIIVTPSQHRVHHAINKEYIDKNLAAIFCIWDRAFGTFQEELDDVPPVYGVLKPAKTWNPILINFQHIWLLLKDAWRTKKVEDKLRIWFMPTGWRPADVIEKYPVSRVEDVYHFEKYNTRASKALKVWSSFQLIITTLLILFMFYSFEFIGFTNLLLYAFLVFSGIFGYSSLMDRSKYAVVVEIFRSLLGLAIIIITTDWFGLNEFIFFGSQIVAIYFICTIIGAIYFTFFDKEFSHSIETLI